MLMSTISEKLFSRLFVCNFAFIYKKIMFIVRKYMILSEARLQKLIEYKIDLWNVQASPSSQWRRFFCT